MPSTTCPGCGRHRNVRRDGRFVKHTVSGFFGGDEYITRPCSHSEADTAILFAEAALRTAEHRARIRRELVERRVASRAEYIAAYDADTEAQRVVADHYDADVAKARATLDALRVPS